MGNHHFLWESPLVLLPFSIAMLVYQRVYPAGYRHVSVLGPSVLHPIYTGDAVYMIGQFISTKKNGYRLKEVRIHLDPVSKSMFGWKFGKNL